VRATLDPHASSQAACARAGSYFNGYADGATACGNDARQAVLLEPVPSGLNQSRERVSPDGHGVRLGWRPAVSRA
jgi:hypothetical protein